MTQTDTCPALSAPKQTSTISSTSPPLSFLREVNLCQIFLSGTCVSGTLVVLSRKS
ncbi:hypothetical protein P692DRAFT_20748322 [Suillus brevipes Sb2]|nr:hypothetical protein P692DRAFT_20748322 [Suillus brevipes Sb2]